MNAEFFKGRLFAWLSLSCVILLGNSLSAVDAGQINDDLKNQLEAPRQIKVAGEPIKTESPGYACPTMADVDGDGDMDLVVGQFNDGLMHLFINRAEKGEPPVFKESKWIEVDGKQAVVPGVW